MAIDGLRAMALLMIYTYHTWEFGDSPRLQVGRIAFGSVIAQFPAGVDLFMVLSGFCLFWPLVSRAGAADRWSAADYAKRRIHRIVPPYYAAIAFVLLQPFILKGVYRIAGLRTNVQQLPNVWYLVTHLTFTHTLFPSAWDKVQGAFWSLGLEAQFYLAFPLVIFGYRRLGLARTAGLMVTISIAYRAVAELLFHQYRWPITFLISVTFLGRWMQFAAGMVAAAVVSRRAHIERWPAVLGISGLAVAVLFYALAVSPVVTFVPLIPFRDLLLASSFATAMVALCTSRSPANFLFENRVIAGIGFISYSVFLIHQNTIYYFGEFLKRILHLGGPTRFALMMTIGLLFILAASYVFFLAFERPFLNVRRQPAKRSLAIPISDATAAALV